MSNFRHNLSAWKVYGEDNYAQLVDTVNEYPGLGGYQPRDFDRFPLGYASPVFEAATIPRAEWTERAEALEVAKATPEHVCAHAGVPILNQSRRPYCWCYGAMGLVMAGYASAGLPVPHLSATSLAAKIKNYRDVGGWAGEAIEGNQRFGVSTIDFWPEAALDRRYDTPEQRENAALHKATEWAELRANSFDHVATALLRGFAVSLGLNWWGHLVYATKLLVISRNRFGVLIRNSWGTDWENGGRGVLEESKATPAEAFIVRSVSKYDKAAA
jgi:hypothetical protein